MSDPETGGFRPDDDRENQPRFTLSLTERQLDVLLLALGREIRESYRVAADLRSEGLNRTAASDDYNALADHLRELEALRTSLGDLR